MTKENLILLSKSFKNYNLIENNKNNEIFTFDYTSHKKLYELGINHSIAENILNYDERLSIFNIAKKFQNWQDDPFFNNFNLNGVNLLSLLDGIELHLLIIEKLVNFFTLKKILEIKDVDIIECSNEMKNMMV